MKPPIRLALAAVFVFGAAVSLACGGDKPEVAPVDGTAVGGPGAPAIGGGNVASPPPGKATSGSSSADLGIGSYCWSGASGGACVDKIGVITKARALSVSRDGTVLVENPVQGAAIQEMSVRAFPATGQPLPVSGGEQAWPYPQTGVVSLTASPSPSRTATGIVFDAGLPPGRHVVDIHLRYQQGSVSYGLLLDVR